MNKQAQEHMHPQVVYSYRKDGTPIYVKCGQWVGGEKQFCDDCYAQFEAQYPQGWRGYPGDTCKHGVYVGGCGADYMCSHCEFGEG